MGIFQFLWNFFFGSFEWVIDFINEWYAQAAQAGFHPDKGTLVGITIVLIIVIGSGLAAMTVAEVRMRQRFIHFFLGMLFPVAYPILLFFVLPEFKIVSKEEKELEKMIASMPDEEGAVPESELRSVAKSDARGQMPAMEHSLVMNQQYFARISTDELGNQTGPFIMEMHDGRILEVDHISGALQNVLAVEVKQDSGECRTIRLPYQNIRSCRLKEEWLNEAEEDVDYDEDQEGDS